MVLFENVFVGQRVEVKYKGHIYAGVVKYKGAINLIKGDWVGVELDEPVGKHNGLFQGRQYFSCKVGHGIFIHASRIRFMAMKRCLFNNYHSIKPSYCEEPLFHTEKPYVRSYTDPALVSSSYVNMATDAFSPYEDDWFETSRSYHLSHSVSNHIKAATMRERSPSLTYSYRSTPIHGFYDEDYDDDFITSPSLPKYHMPHVALVRQNKRGWDDTVTRPREWSL
ncbi:uncharacterized protein [Ptychodera flava]|uniref:uncharacterized protein n=1 Tax=Ptychodera flava TaxID=63121 RepID=UPI00396A67F2